MDPVAKGQSCWKLMCKFVNSVQPQLPLPIVSRGKLSEEWKRQRKDNASTREMLALLLPNIRKNKESTTNVEERLKSVDNLKRPLPAYS